MRAVFEQYHLEVERLDDDGDVFMLRQVDHSGDEDRIALHTSQIRYLAELAGLLPAPLRPSTLAAPVANGEAMHSLEVESDSDGMIWIEQTRLSGMGGTDAAIELHPSQAAWLATRLQWMAGQGETREVATLRRRMLTLYRKLIDLAGHFAWDDLFARSAFADDLFNDVNLAAELANEFVADILETGNGKGGRASERNEKSRAISVTPDAPKRGRPETGDAMSNAERQARHRAKQKDSPQRELEGIQA